MSQIVTLRLPEEAAEAVRQIARRERITVEQRTGPGAELVDVLHPDEVVVVEAFGLSVDVHRGVAGGEKRG